MLGQPAGGAAEHCVYVTVISDLSVLALGTERWALDDDGRLMRS